ncbi:heme-binding protein 1-like [Amphibalanus amphitrite]|uniref:heme-binding protein 1-like n=1 Tax=Amphibalanus amphitrite TaxID=1232801 RepID=UPI001C9157E4|nr:heme-binding protein 1-like [Amphibalanus amphitrite]
MRLYVVIVMALSAGARAGQGGGILQTIRNGLNSAAATITSPFVTTEMVPYTVDRTVMDANNKTVLYEQRTYPGQKWVCTSKVIDTSEGGSDGIFMRLFRYISGENEQNQTVPMTSPVSMLRVPLSPEITVTEEGEPQSRLTMCFYINKEFQENPPAPSSPDVFLEERPTMTVIANRVGGYMSEDDWQDLAKKLKDDATANGETGVDYSKFYRAGYDSPMKLWNRRNEVWYVKQV